MTRSPRAATTGSREPELREALPDPHDAREPCAVPRCTWTRAPSAIGSSSSSDDVQRYEVGYAPRRDERVAARDLAPLDAREG